MPQKTIKDNFSDFSRILKNINFKKKIILEKKGSEKDLFTIRNIVCSMFNLSLKLSFIFLKIYEEEYYEIVEKQLENFRIKKHVVFCRKRYN